MIKTLDEQFLNIKNSTGEEQEKLFLEYCLTLIDLKEKGELTEEEVGYKMVCIWLAVKGLSKFEQIFDTTSDLEIPRETSYRQPIGSWDQKTADTLKGQEWEGFVKAVHSFV